MPHLRLFWSCFGILTSHQFLSSSCRQVSCLILFLIGLLTVFKLFSPGEGTVWVGVAWGRRLWLVTCASLHRGAVGKEPACWSSTAQDSNTVRPLVAVCCVSSNRPLRASGSISAKRSMLPYVEGSLRI